MKEIVPVVEQVQEVYKTFETLSNDELRQRSFTLKKKIKDYVGEEEKQMAGLKEKGEDPEVDVNNKEDIYNQIDKLIETIDEKYEVVLR